MLTLGVLARGNPIRQTPAAEVKAQHRFAGNGEPKALHLSKDGSRIAMQQPWPPLRDFSVEAAANQSEQAHWQEARAVAKGSAEGHLTSQFAAPERAARTA
jgi:hypothetical protein